MSPTLHKIPIHENPKYVKSGIKSYAWLLNKYNLTPPQNSPFYRAQIDEAVEHIATHQRILNSATRPVGRLMKRVAGDDEGRHVTTEDIQSDTLYLSTVSIKGQAKPFRLDFDSGSSDLWIMGKELTKKFPGASAHNLFDVHAPGFTPIAGSSFEIHFGDGSWAKGSVGHVGKADLEIGGLVVEGQAVEVANDVHKSFITGDGDGLLGLAWGSINSVRPTRVQTPVENMITQGDISRDQELFTCKLGSFHDADEPDQGESFYTFGFIDQPTVAAAEGPIWYTPIVHDSVDRSSGFWRFSSTSVVVNGKTFARANNTAIADTGTTLALIDDEALKHIYAQIPKAKNSAQQGGWIYPANTKLEQLPVIRLDVGGKQFVIQKEDIGFAPTGDGWIFGSFQSRGEDQPFDILGDAFLKSVYAIFDQGFDQGNGKKGRFGVAQRKELHQNLNFPSS